MFKITNAQLIQMAAVDAGLDPYAEYLTRDNWKAQGAKVKRGEKPVLTLELWCPRIRENSADSEAQESEASVKTFFQFKKCHLFSREQTEESQDAKEQERLSQQAAGLRIYHAYHQHNPQTGYLEIIESAPEVAKIAAEWIRDSKLGSCIFPIDFVEAEKGLKT